MYRSRRSHFDNSCGSSPSWLDCVSFVRNSIYLAGLLAGIYEKIPTAFAIAVGVFRENKGRSWSLAASIAATRFLFSQNWDIYTLRSFMGATTFQVYQKWAQREKQEVVTDLLPEGAKLHWIGPRRDASQDRVILYFHGDSGLSHFFFFFYNF